MIIHSYTPKTASYPIPVFRSCSPRGQNLSSRSSTPSSHSTKHPRHLNDLCRAGTCPTRTPCSPACSCSCSCSLLFLSNSFLFWKLWKSDRAANQGFLRSPSIKATKAGNEPVNSHSTLASVRPPVCPSPSICPQSEVHLASFLASNIRHPSIHAFYPDSLLMFGFVHIRNRTDAILARSCRAKGKIVIRVSEQVCNSKVGGATSTSS